MKAIGLNMILFMYCMTIAMVIVDEGYFKPLKEACPEQAVRALDMGYIPLNDCNIVLRNIQTGEPIGEGKPRELLDSMTNPEPIKEEIRKDLDRAGEYIADLPPIQQAVASAVPDIFAGFERIYVYISMISGTYFLAWAGTMGIPSHLILIFQLIFPIAMILTIIKYVRRVE
ncbi:MAG: hypothetical protein MPK62_00425 [Alphaproteobacteria bacterium]|nr:hypothetical protein [Alphaproteobacteria bacterium]MDA8029603.1 hypothetical protein [Alphaproteobacteria bacterium]